ncbi:hypothetical protein AXF14_06365 [Actinomyces radicidentis]|uniref:Uncharacterized protein n=1 Tax=Actinomyces radicidentis TaxID=111015 RepID=A0A0X8JEC7_ACTRD|nr:hypothetical protein AXF14_06365 [Actinomyces radicidentis]
MEVPAGKVWAVVPRTMARVPEAAAGLRAAQASSPVRAAPLPPLEPPVTRRVPPASTVPVRAQVAEAAPPRAGTYWRERPSRLRSEPVGLRISTNFCW